MKRIFALCMAACLMLSGCASVFDGSYVSTMPHQEQGGVPGGIDTQVSEYDALLAALIAMAERGSKTGIIYVSGYDPEQVDPDMEKAAKAALVKSPIAAYAVEEITWDLGTNSGQRAVAVNITYFHERSEIMKIHRVKDIDEAIELLYKELGGSSPGVVFYMEKYTAADYVQLTEQYAFDNPHAVMETPQVVANVYPKNGSTRVVELKFTYQNSREELQRLKTLVLTLYSSSKHSVTSDAKDREKFSQLYSYLMDRRFGDYTIETSITPAYSLLWHGAGDSKAFATLYAAFCRFSDLECRVITGTRNGEPWYWNLVKTEEGYFHLDLLRNHEAGGFQLLLDGEMAGYVWDYSAYPSTPIEPTETTQPEQPTQPT